MIYFYNIININLLKFYKNKNINNELILEMLDNNKIFIEKQLIIKIKIALVNNNKIKSYYLLDF